MLWVGWQLLQRTWYQHDIYTFSQASRLAHAASHSIGTMGSLPRSTLAKVQIWPLTPLWCQSELVPSWCTQGQLSTVRILLLCIAYQTSTGGGRTPWVIFMRGPKPSLAPLRWVVHRTLDFRQGTLQTPTYLNYIQRVTNISFKLVTTQHRPLYYCWTRPINDTHNHKYILLYFANWLAFFRSHIIFVGVLKRYKNTTLNVIHSVNTFLGIVLLGQSTASHQCCTCIWNRNWDRNMYGWFVKYNNITSCSCIEWFIV